MQEIFTKEEWKEIQEMQAQQEATKKIKCRLEEEKRRLENKREKIKIASLIFVCIIIIIVLCGALYVINDKAISDCISAGNSAEYCEKVID